MRQTVEFYAIQTQLTDWQRDRDALIAIRRQVFVEEQGVPLTAEIDHLDPQAHHWLARDGDGQLLGTARLVGNRIGRMAVFAAHRNKGVGSSLLRAILRHAHEQQLETLVLDAQVQALSFYRNFGFAVCGDAFDDVGIAHRPMTLNLSRFAAGREQTAPTQSHDTQHGPVTLTEHDSFACAALACVSSADRTVRLYSEQLDHQLYDSDAFCRALFRTATRHPLTQVMVLVADTAQLLTRPHRLVELLSRLTSDVELRKLNPERHTVYSEMIVADQRASLYNRLSDNYRGYYYPHAPHQARLLSHQFDSLWHSSERDSQLRRLNL